MSRILFLFLFLVISLSVFADVDIFFLNSDLARYISPNGVLVDEYDARKLRLNFDNLRRPGKPLLNFRALDPQNLNMIRQLVESIGVEVELELYSENGVFQETPRGKLKYVAIAARDTKPDSLAFDFVKNGKQEVRLDIGYQNKEYPIQSIRAIRVFGILKGKKPELAGWVHRTFELNDITYIDYFLNPKKHRMKSSPFSQEEDLGETHYISLDKIPSKELEQIKNAFYLIGRPASVTYKPPHSKHTLLTKGKVVGVVVSTTQDLTDRWHPQIYLTTTLKPGENFLVIEYESQKIHVRFTDIENILLGCAKDVI